MPAIYRFKLGTRYGHVEGDYDLAQALEWALDDLSTGRAEPVLVAEGRKRYNLKQLRKTAGMAPKKQTQEGAD